MASHRTLRRGKLAVILTDLLLRTLTTRQSRLDAKEHMRGLGSTG